MIRRASRRAAPLVAVALLTGCGGGEAAPTTSADVEQSPVPAEFPAGTYRATITSADAPTAFGVWGEWTLALMRDGRWELDGLSEAGRAVFTSGRYAVRGGELTILSDTMCATGQAVVAWSADGDELRLEPVREECREIRTSHLTAKPWTKVGEPG